MISSNAQLSLSSSTQRIRPFVFSIAWSCFATFLRGFLKKPTRTPSYFLKYEVDFFKYEVDFFKYEVDFFKYEVDFSEGAPGCLFGKRHSGRQFEGYVDRALSNSFLATL